MKRNSVDELAELLGIAPTPPQTKTDGANEIKTETTNSPENNFEHDGIDELLFDLEKACPNKNAPKSANPTVENSALEKPKVKNSGAQPTPNKEKSVSNSAPTAKELFLLGSAYFKGETKPKNFAKAAEYYRQAAEQGYAPAQRQLGYCYSKGCGVEKNHGLAVKWYTLAAEQGYAQAQCDLGICYKNGENVTRDYAKAFKWYFRAAEQGYAQAQCYLGLCYYYGEGTPKSFTEAKKWLTISANKGYAPAKNYLQTLKFSL